MSSIKYTLCAQEANPCKLNILFVSPSVIELSANNLEFISSGF